MRSQVEITKNQNLFVIFNTQSLGFVDARAKDFGFRYAPKNINDMFSRHEINSESFGVHIDGKSFNEYIDMFLSNYDELFKTLIELKKYIH